jgi:beta-glucosidase
VRLFTARIETGEFDDENSVPWVKAARARLGGAPWVSNEANNAVTETPARLKQAQDSADQSLVLLKNQPAAGKGSLLPLQVPHSGSYKVAVVGYPAHPQSLFLGGYSSVQAGAGAANNVDAYTGIKDAVTKADPNAQVDFLPGTISSTSDPTKTNVGTQTSVDPGTIAQVGGYDAVVVVAGTDSSTNSEDKDRSTLALPGAQAQLIQQVEAANPRTVVYLETTGTVDTRSFDASTPALLWSSYNGQRQGAALADVLLGKVNPSGHLPFTWYTDDSQLPAIGDYAIRPTASSPGRTYMYFTGSSSYPFGYGQSYSQFAYSNLKVAPRADAEGTITATADVTNRGTVAGAAVPQLYAATPFEPASAQRPDKRLEAFSKVTLQPGQTKKVTLSFPVSKLAFFDEAANKFSVDPGTYQLQLAGSAADADIAQTAPVAVSGSLGSVPTVVTAHPVQNGDREADVAQRVMVDAGSTIDPQLTVSLDDQTLHGYVSKGESSPLPAGLDVQYRSDDPRVVRVGPHGELQAVGSGVVTVHVTARSKGHAVSTAFTVDVAPLQITSEPTATLAKGTPGTVQITTATTQSPTAAEVPAISVTGTLPPGLSVHDNGDGTATLTGTPTTPGTYQVAVRAVNKVSRPADQSLVITVTG